MPAVQADFFRKKSENAAVQAVYKKNCRLFPSDMSLGKIPLKDKTLEKFPQRHVAGESTATWHNSLTKKYVGPTFRWGLSLGNVLPSSLPPSTFPQRHFAGDRVPQRHVAGERVGMLLGKASNVVVTID
ncbi:hypothetical protein Tco_0409201 [Tanacetum coccineum]